MAQYCSNVAICCCYGIGASLLLCHLYSHDVTTSASPVSCLSRFVLVTHLQLPGRVCHKPELQLMYMSSRPPLMRIYVHTSYWYDTALCEVGC